MTAMYSFWEKDSFFSKSDIAILGGGLVGINAAISVKKMFPDLRVVVIERGSIPTGASTRNAGFACFGSVTELLDDIKKGDEEHVLKLLQSRYEGLRFLRERVGDHFLDYKSVGGYEVFDQELNVTKNYKEQVSHLNQLIEQRTGLKATFSLMESPYHFTGLNDKVIFNQHEGCLHPGMMMQHLYKMANDVGVILINGITIKDISEFENAVLLSSDRLELETSKLAICTNGFTNSIFPDLALKPARNQVLVTEEIPNLKINSCFHYDEGYTYFRNIGKRVLIGGARNIDAENEQTSDFGMTEKIKSHLLETLIYKIGIAEDTKIEFEWSGIMGVGDVKTPILKKHSDNIIFAVRLGGMGVALGAKLGDDCAKLLLRYNTH